jgi:hypothetical protein
MTRKLQPPKNFREVVPHICTTCRYIKADDGAWFCQRAPDAIIFDMGDRYDIVSTCDGWRNGMGWGPDALKEVA